jgi:hypothetical protein
VYNYKWGFLYSAVSTPKHTQRAGVYIQLLKGRSCRGSNPSRRRAHQPICMTTRPNLHPQCLISAQLVEHVLERRFVIWSLLMLICVKIKIFFSEIIGNRSNSGVKGAKTKTKKKNKKPRAPNTL